MEGKACSNPNEEEQNSARIRKRSVSDRESGFSFLLNAAKKAHSEVPLPADQGRLGEVEGSGSAQDGKYIGVRWSKKKAKWRVRIKANGKDNHVGFFSDIMSAATAYDRAVLRFFPSAALDRSARLNFPHLVEETLVNSLAESKPDSDSPSPAIEKGAQYSSTAGVNSLLQAAVVDNVGLDQTRSKSNYASAFSGSLSSPRTRLLSTFGQNGSGTQGLSLPVPLPPLNLAPFIVSRQSQQSTPAGTKHNVHLSPLAPPIFRLSGDTTREKSSIAHLLDDKSTLERGTPSTSPLDESSSITPSNHSVGGYSAISTPATMPSPSLILSPIAGCSNGSRSQSTSNASRPCPPFSNTPPIFSSSFAPSRICNDSRGFIGPAVSFTAHPPSTLQPLSIPMSYASYSSQGSESQHSELEALKGLVKLGDSSDGPKTRRSKNQIHRGDVKTDKVAFRLCEDESVGHSSLAILGSASEQRWTADRFTSEITLPRVMEGGKLGGAKNSLDMLVEHGEGTSAAVLVRPLINKSVEERGKPACPAASKRSKTLPKTATQPDVAKSVEAPVQVRDASSSPHPSGKTQSFRGVTWDKVKQMWRVRLCLAGGGREHVGYFANEEAGALAYARALERLKQQDGALPQRALERHSQERDGRLASSALAATLVAGPAASGN